MRKESAEKDLATPLEQQRQKYLKRKREHGDRSNETYAKLQEFTAAMRSGKAIVDKDGGTKEKKEEKEHYRGQVLEKDGSDDEDLTDWHSGKLKFKKHIDDKFREGVAAGGDGRHAYDYEVLDPKKAGGFKDKARNAEKGRDRS